MVDVLVFVHRDATLARCSEVTRELEQAGLKLKASYPSVGVIVGAVEDRSVVARLQKIKDVTAVTEQ